MTRTSNKNTNKVVALAAALLATAGHAQEPSAEICAGNDAVGGSVNAIVEAGTRVFALTSNSVDHPRGGGLYISCAGGDAWYKHPEIPHGGETIVADPADASTIYAGIGGGFVYVSRDAGDTWSSHRPVEFGNIGVSALAILSGGHVYAGMGTGELLKSSDYGSSWQSLNATLPSDTIRQILVDPVNTSRILVVAGTNGVYQSLDGGQNFTQGTFPGLILPLAFWDVRDIVFTPSNTSQVSAGGPAGIWQSVDGGHVFSGVGDMADVIDISFGRRDTNTMFAVSEFAGVLRSTDVGQTFVLLRPELGHSTDWFRSALQLESGRLLVGTVAEGIVKSDDDGATWQSAGTPPPPPFEPAPPQTTEVTARLSVSIDNLNGESVEAGNEAKFRIVVRNDGPETSTSTFVHVDWILPGTGGAESTAFSLSSSVGSCAVEPNADTGCTIGSIGTGSSVTIELRGKTSTSFIGSHSINVTARNAQGADVTANDGVASKRTIFCAGDCDDSSSGGGGSAGMPLLGVLALVTLLRRRRATARNDLCEHTGHVIAGSACPRIA
jgi:MYXO-CTERM domain-containing protein